MTLTAILPSLRGTLPDPLDPDRWPEQTHPSPTDVIVGGISMVRLAELCDTPCVHSGAAVIPGTDGRPAATGETTVVLTSVTGVRSGQGPMVLELDAHLGRVPGAVTEARLIGRLSPARLVGVRLSDALGTAVDGQAMLPADLGVGDLIAIPCAGMVLRRQLRSDTERPAWLGTLE